MDQGLAALVAGGFGLVGAAIGGGAAVWGARQQVRSQAIAEHQHWNRQMRREAYEGFVNGVSETIDSFGLVAAALRRGSGIEDARDQLERRLYMLLSLGTRIALAGPEHLDHLANEAATKLHLAGDRLLAIDTVSELGTSETDRLMDAAAEAADAFTKAARRELQHRSP